MDKTVVAKLSRIRNDHGKSMMIKTLIFPVVRYVHLESHDYNIVDKKRKKELILREINITQRLSKIIQKSILSNFNYIMRKRAGTSEER